jgi:hypothetical protein
VYEKPSNSTKNFASLFMALDLRKEGDYGQESRKPYIPKPPLSKIKFPSLSLCPDLTEFLQIVFPEYLQGWQLVDDPLCKEGNTCYVCDVSNPSNPPSYPVSSSSSSYSPSCRKAPVDKENYSSKEISDTDAEYPLYWRFKERTHTISGAMRFLFWLKPPPPSSVSNERSDNPVSPFQWYGYGFLWIGYGGNSGAG